MPRRVNVWVFCPGVGEWPTAVPRRLNCFSATGFNFIWLYFMALKIFMYIRKIIHKSGRVLNSSNNFVLLCLIVILLKKFLRIPITIV